MNERQRGLVKAGGLVSGAGGLMGGWFWQHEISYAASHPKAELARSLQWVGLAVLAIGAGGALISWALLNGDE